MLTLTYLPKKDADRHQPTDGLVAASSGAKKLTVIVQKMQLHLWEAYLEHAQQHVRDADRLDAEAAATEHDTNHWQQDKYYD